MTYKANTMREHIDKLTYTLLKQKEEYIFDAIKELIKSGAITLEQNNGEIVELGEGVGSHLYEWRQEVKLKVNYQKVHPKCKACDCFKEGSEGTSDHCGKHDMRWTAPDSYCSEHSDLKKV